MPLGGLGTGCLDIETTGVLGFSSIFFPSAMVEPTPYQTLRNPQILAPFLGMAVGGKTWSKIADRLPAATAEDSGASAAVTFDLRRLRRNQALR